MENPCMTFATPTVIAGDKSLVSLIAHELAHSWSGNLVTNAGWRDMWLNEGFTTYVENRIVEAVYGKAQADEQFILAADELRGELDDTPKNDQRLVPDFQGRDPDDAGSDFAYTRARGSCARSRKVTGAMCSTRTCADISNTSHSRASRPTRCSRIWTRI
jgi:aminopeptidase N